VALLVLVALTQASLSISIILLPDYFNQVDSRLADCFRFFMLGMSVLQLSPSVFGWFYRESLRDAKAMEDTQPVLQPSEDPGPGPNAYYERLKGNYYK
jgi:hypothetical protein